MQPALLETLRSEKMAHTFFELLNTTDLEHLISQAHHGASSLESHDIDTRWASLNR